MTYFVGIDVAKYLHYASIISSYGDIIELPFPFDNNKSGFDLLLSKLQRLDSKDIVIGYESTAHYHLNLHDFLTSLDYKCIIINPILTKRFRGLNIRNIKTDKIDSLSISNFLAFNYSNLSSSSSNSLQDLRVYCEELHSLKEQKTRLYIQLTSCLDIIFPELRDIFFKGNLKTVAAHNLLKVMSLPDSIANARIDYLTNIISKGSKGFNRERVESLKALAKVSVGVNSSSYSFKVSNLIRHIELVEEQIESTLAVINNIMIEKESPLLNIPGMGYVQAAYILSVIDSIDRFKSVKQLLAYAGLDPIIRQSGTFNASSTRMSKRGNTLLRYALVWSSYNIVKNSTTMKTYYTKKRNEGKSHYNALGHCSRKLISYIFWILKNPEKEFTLE